MSREQSDAATQQRHGRGVFDCPLGSCDEVIVGSYGDLLEHVRSHPFAKLLADSSGEGLIEQIKEAQSDALKKDIRQTFKIDTEDN